MKRILPITILLLLLCSPAWAATYYVSNAGNDDTGDGSEGTPWATIAKAMSQVSASDTISLNKGDTWTESVTFSQNSLTLNAYGAGVAPIISGGIALTGWAASGSLYTKSYSGAVYGLVESDTDTMLLLAHEPDSGYYTAGATGVDRFNAR